MTHKDQPDTMRRIGMAWIMARRLLRSHLLDWPDSLTPEDLAKLQYPDEGTAESKRTARRNRSAMLEALQASMAADEIETVIHEQTIPIIEERTDWSGIGEQHQRAREFGVKDSWLERDQSGLLPTKRVQVGEKHCETIMITRHGAARWLRQEDAVPSVHVQAWLISGEPMPTVAPTVATMNQNRNAERMDRLGVAIEAGLKAYRAKHKTTPTAGDLWDWLGEHDDTGVIEETALEKITWRTSGGKLKDTSRKAFENRLPRMRKRNPT